MKREGKFNLSAQEDKKNRYISFYIFSEFSDLSQKLNVSFDNETISEHTVLPKWNIYSFPLQTQPSTSSSELTLSLNKVFPQEHHVSDARELGIRVSQPQFHDDEDIHRDSLFFQENALLNFREMSEGKTILDSFPLSLGVDLYGKCNINPPCVYCLWDRMKELEGEYVNTNVDEKTLEGYHPFFRSARLIINCSFGEPLLHPRFGEILEFCAQQKKILEISTNRQTFSKRTIQALVGKPVYLYVSLDAACKETYAKIRNDRWDAIIPNLILLNKERKKKGNLPKIYMVFMPMEVNRKDLEDYFRLCKEIEADSLVLRPLNYLENPQIEKDRGGYHFDYEKELLSLLELEKIFQKCDEYSKKYGVPVANQFTFGEIDKLSGKGTSSHSPEKQRF
jgi:MoaA/NifB/PqqE/SkfB family radical SAM enzyme